MTASKSTNKSPVQTPNLKLSFYRQCRLWHGYLSAFAFIALLFFAVTGIFLNHPEWFKAKTPTLNESSLTLTPAQLQVVRDAERPAEALHKIVAEHAALYGEYKNGEVAAGQVFVRLQGARGSSDIRATLDDGSVAITTERATTIALLNALHRGELTGATWRAVIDIAAGVLIVLSLVGYLIFLSMNSRLKTALLITGASVLATLALFATMVR